LTYPYTLFFVFVLFLVCSRLEQSDWNLILSREKMPRFHRTQKNPWVFLTITPQMGRRTSPLTFLVLLALVAGFLPANAQILSKGSVVTLRSFNYPNRGLAPQNEANQILLSLQSSLFTPPA